MLIKCQRCGAQHNDKSMEWMLFKSQYKETKVVLCFRCLESCRRVFDMWMKKAIQ